MARTFSTKNLITSEFQYFVIKQKSEQNQRPANQRSAKTSRTLILHNNNSNKLSINYYKSNHPEINRLAYPFYI